MKTKILVRMGLALAALFATGLAGAQAQRVGPGFDHSRPPMERMLGPRSPNGHWWNNPAMVEKLKLTDEQRKAMDGILLQHREKLIDLRANLEKAELVLKPMMMSQDQPNEAGILAQIDKIATARADLEKANARFLLAIRAKLTADQWKTLQAGWAGRRHNRSWDRENRGMRGHGMRNRGTMPPPAGAPNPPSPPSPPADANQ